MGVPVIPFGVKNAVLVPPRVFSLKTSTAGAFVAPFRVQSLKMNMTGDTVEPPVAITCRKQPSLFSDHVYNILKVSESNHYIWNLL